MRTIKDANTETVRLFNDEWESLLSIAADTHSTCWQHLVGRIARGELVVREAKAEPKGQWVWIVYGRDGNNELQWLDVNEQWVDYGDRAKRYTKHAEAAAAAIANNAIVWRVV